MINDILLEDGDNMKEMINAFTLRTVDSAIEGFMVEHNDEITNGVKDYLNKLSEEELLEVKKFLNKLLNYCYDGKLYDEELNEEYEKVKNLDDKDKFLLKETVIYFIGRLPISCDMDLLKKAYSIDNDRYIKLNICFTSLESFDEEIEMDFVNKVLADAEYDLMIRSWTMAFFKNVTDPYEYRDSENDDWTVAKTPRIKRLRINDETDPKFKKAMAFRLLDLVVLYLFVNNRKDDSLTEEEKLVIESADIKYEKYSDSKKELMAKLKNMILKK